MTRLLAHYWTADDHPATRQAQIEDWLEDLREFSPDVVEVACRGWRQSSDKRPTPYGIRVLAIAEQRRRNPEPEPLYIPPPAPTERTPEEIAHAEKCVDEIKRIVADSIPAQRRKPNEQWQIGARHPDAGRTGLISPDCATAAASATFVQDDPNTDDPKGEQL